MWRAYSRKILYCDWLSSRRVWQASGELGSRTLRGEQNGKLGTLDSLSKRVIDGVFFFFPKNRRKGKIPGTRN